MVAVERGGIDQNSITIHRGKVTVNFLIGNGIQVLVLRLGISELRFLTHQEAIRRATLETDSSRPSAPLTRRPVVL